MHETAKKQIPEDQGPEDQATALHATDKAFISKLPPLKDGEDPLDIFRFPGVIEIHSDIMAPIYSDEEW